MTAPVSAPSDAIETLYCDHHGWLQGWLRKKLGSRPDAADLAHDVFLRVLTKRDSSELREPRAYLTTIAKGLVVNHWRRRALEQAYLDELATQPAHLAPSPEERSVILETLEEISALLAGLPALVREAFLLSQLDGLSYPQIAEALGLTVNVVQKSMTRAVTHCYKALYAYGP